MGRYRAPSCSTVSSQDSLATVGSAGRQPTPMPRLPTLQEHPTPVAGPSVARSAAHRPDRVDPQPVQKRDKGKGKMHARSKPSKPDAGLKERLRMARKKKEAKAAAKPDQTEWSFVYVGNLSSSVTEEQVETLFKECGPIRRLQIRASGGICVPTANMKRGLFGFGGVDTGVHYATVEYEKPASARLAMNLDGQEIHGRQIIVTYNPADLPETCNVLQSLIAKQDAHLEKRQLWKERFGQLKRLTIQRTERVIEGEGPTTLVASVAMRLGLYDPAAGTAAGAHQNVARHRLPMPGALPSFPIL